MGKPKFLITRIYILTHYIFPGEQFSERGGSAEMDGGGMGNVYEVEHLATFQLSEELNAPSDGMRRLLHMEKNGFGIWSQKMRVRLERNFIVILDFENGVSQTLYFESSRAAAEIKASIKRGTVLPSVSCLKVRIDSIAHNQLINCHEFRNSANFFNCKRLDKG